jgi:hypothetical protein
MDQAHGRSAGLAARLKKSLNLDPAEGNNPFFQLGKGIAKYRAGRYAEAAEGLGLAAGGTVDGAAAAGDVTRSAAAGNGATSDGGSPSPGPSVSSSSPLADSRTVLRASSASSRHSRRAADAASGPGSARPA